ncbi:hypothetical protein N865_18160 [Intrasporangium oryzae NRRL B-24470]|uniref:Tetracyclin repressor-like C-terminal group 31 domain-containing protein n=1 Tax=Intrasporangium oryzae NRRL B-24470 TaxID=1386089 RepID=W9G8D5_9MICO|nr:TetR/AcrR family transcriptional regulator [Intrasporangium oryzae]EWT00124.1 hypothetical protein N865_18160 [Intrasporangium oryzae NRRL B-24470]
MPDRSTPLSPRMHDLLEAAVSVVASGGLRGLTHRAVDARAGLPLGTCSAYLRTRLALQTALAQYVADRLADDITALSKRLAKRPGDSGYAADQTTALFVAWLDDRDLVVARLELSLEAAREPALAEVFAAWREQLLDVVGETVSRSGRANPRAQAEATVSALEGVLLAALLKPPTECGTFVGDTVSTLLGALAAYTRDSGALNAPVPRQALGRVPT